MAEIIGTTAEDLIRLAAAGGSSGGLPDATDDGDLIDAGEGDDTVLAGAGDDTVVSGEGADSLDGGDGVNTLDFSAASQGVAMVLAQGDLFDDGYGNGEKALGFTVALGSAFRDPLFAGSADGDTLYGNGGNDDVYGNGGDDTVFGGDDDDLVVGEEGLDSVAGDAGNDTLIGGRTDEAVFDDGATGLGQLAEDANTDTLDGGAGDDSITLGDGDVGTGGEGNDVFAFAAYGNPLVDQPLAVGTAVFAGNYADYTVFADGDYLYIADNAGSDGTDQIGRAILLPGLGQQIVATLQFADQSVDVLSAGFDIAYNQAPVVEGARFDIDSNTGLGSSVFTYDDDGDPLTFVGVARGPDNGTLSDVSFDLETGRINFTYNPNAGYFDPDNPDTFDVAVSDGYQTTIGTIEIYVAFDSAGAEAFVVGVGRAFSFDLGANDLDEFGDAPTWFSLDYPMANATGVGLDNITGVLTGIAALTPGFGVASYTAEFPTAVPNAAPVFLTVAELDESLAGTDDADAILGYGLADTIAGGLGDDTIDGGSGNDVAVFAGDAGDYTITQSGLAVTVEGAEGTDIVRRVETLRFADTDYDVVGSYDPLAGATDGTLVRGLGGTAGFGENALALGDSDEAGERIDLAPIFGGALDFFGEQVTAAFVNANGHLVFNQGWGTYFRTPLLGGVDISTIAPFWVDLSATGGSGTSPGGNSQGTGRVWWDMDADNAVLTVTWDDLPFLGGTADALNAFQLQLVGRGGDGDFDIIFRYEATANGPDAVAGFANTPDSAVYELPGSGTTVTGALDTTEGNTGLPGLWRFSVRDGEIAPSGGNDSYATEEDTPLVVAAADGLLDNDSDPLGRPLTALLEQGPGNGELVLNADGSFTYTPNANFFGTEVFTYRVGSGLLVSDAITVLIDVAGANDAPFALGFSGSVSESAAVGTAVGILGGVDPETPAEGLTYELIDDAGGLFVLDGRTVRVAGALDYESAILHDLIVRVTDPQGLSFDGTARVFVTNVNEGPASISFSPESNTFPALLRENLDAGAKVGEVSATDTEGDPITFSVLGGAVEIRNGNEIYTTRPFDYETEGSFSFSIRAQEPSGDGVNGSFTVELTNFNERPIAVNDLREVYAGRSVNINVLLNDRDPDDLPGALDPLEIAGTTQPANGVVTRDGGVFTYTPNAGFSGTDSFTYFVQDAGALLSNEATVTIEVLPYDIVGQTDTYEIAEDDFLVTLDVLGNDQVLDPDGNPIDGVDLFIQEISLLFTKGTAFISADGKSIIYTPNANNDTFDDFSYTITDRNGIVSDFVSVDIALTPVPDDPFQVASITFSDVSNDRPFSGFVSHLQPQYIEDADFGDRIEVIAGSGVSDKGGTVTWTGVGDRLEFTYLAPEEYEGPDRFAFTYNDFSDPEADGSFVANGGSHVGFVTLNVVGPEPIGAPDIYRVQVGQTVTGNVLTNDRSPVGDTPLDAFMGFDNQTPISPEGPFSFTAERSGTFLWAYVPTDSVGREGDATYLQITVDPLPPPPDPAFPGGQRIPGGSVWGDPHFVTFDGLAYDFQGWGEYVLARATEGRDFEVQIRTRPWVEGAQVTIVEAAVARIGDHAVEIGIDGTLLVDGVATTLAAGGDPLLLGDDVGLWRLSAGEYVFSHDDGEKVRFSVGPSYMDVRPVPGPDRTGKLVGLLGDADGNLADDLQLADGTVLGTTLTSTVLYGDYASAWRLTEATSLFTYAAGEGTADYQRPDFPPAKITVADLPPEVVEAAEALVDAAGITDPALREAAILDLVLTGETAFLETAADLPDPVEAATITTPPPPPLVGLASPLAAVTEGGTGTTATIAFTAFRTGDTTGEVTLGWAVQALGAGFANAADFDGGALPTGSVTFGIGETEATITLTIAGDATAELDETIRLALTGVPGGVVVASATAQGTIANDDGPVVAVLGNDTAIAVSGTQITINLLANDSDPAGQALSVSGIGAASGGTVSLNVQGQALYLPRADFTGEDSFTYTVTDARGGTATGNVTVTVLPPNVAPVAGDDAVSVGGAAQDVTAALLGNDDDADEDALAIAAIDTTGTLGTVTLDTLTGAVAYQAPSGFASLAGGATLADSFGYTVADPDGLSDDAIVSVTIVGENDAPTAIGLSGTSIAENAVPRAVVGLLSLVDPDIGDGAAFSLLDDAGGRFDVVGNELRVVGGLDYETATRHEIRILGADSAGLSVERVVTIAIGNATGLRVVGTAGNDLIEPGIPGPGLLVTSAEMDTVQAGQGADTVRGGDAGDRLFGQDGDDSLAGEAGDDRMVAGTGSDVADGGNGADQAYGEAGADTLLGGAGNDQSFGGLANDLLDGGTGADTLSGEDGADTVAGGGGRDSLSGGNLADLLEGGAGADTLVGGAGADTLSGGAGGDVFDIRRAGQSNGAGADVVLDFDAGIVAGPDRVRLTEIDADWTLAGNQYFVFIGDAAFTGTAQLRVVEEAGFGHRIEGNMDADGEAELVLRIAGGAAPEAAWFLL